LLGVLISSLYKTHLRHFKVRWYSKVRVLKSSVYVTWEVLGKQKE
jgi:hypothetical protein